MQNNQANEKLFLIRKLMDSYILGNEKRSDKWLVDKFDKLYDMEVDALRYLAELRKIKLTNLIEV